MANLIDGKLISTQIKDELKEEVAELKKKGIEGCLAVIQVGNDPASSVWQRHSIRFLMMQRSLADQVVLKSTYVRFMRQQVQALL